MEWTGWTGNMYECGLIQNVWHKPKMKCLAIAWVEHLWQEFHSWFMLLQGFPEGGKKMRGDICDCSHPAEPHRVHTTGILLLAGLNNCINWLHDGHKKLHDVLYDRHQDVRSLVWWKTLFLLYIINGIIHYVMGKFLQCMQYFYNRFLNQNIHDEKNYQMEALTDCSWELFNGI